MRSNTVKTSYYACTKPGAHRYPNAADRRITAEKLVEGAMAAAITLAVVMILVVLFTM